MPTYIKKIDLTATSGSAILEAVHGVVTAIRIERSVGTPTVTIAETSGTQETLINALAVAANITKTPQKLAQTNAGVDTTQYTLFSLNGSLTISITGATNPSTITIYVKTV